MKTIETTEMELEAIWSEYKAEATTKARETLIIHYSPLVKYVVDVAAGLAAERRAG
ncbi:MAG: hypothetical protein R2735_01965 [Microthrixaceae bacterium]